MRTTLILVTLATGLACDTKMECRDLPIQPVEEARMCLGTPTTASGVRACLDPDQEREKDLFSLCLTDPAGRLYRATVGSSEWIEGTGWNHSEIPRAASTLSADAEGRCAQSPAPDHPLAPTCTP